MEELIERVLLYIAPLIGDLGYTKDEIRMISGMIADEMWMDVIDESEDVVSEAIKRAVDSVLPFLRMSQRAASRSIQKIQESNQRSSEDYTQSLKELLASMDAKSIADYNAKIEERQYWRKLRGDIFLEFLRKSKGEGFKLPIMNTDVCLYELYKQDKEFGEENFK